MPADPGVPLAAGFLAGFDAFAGRSSSRVVRCAINKLYELSILPQNEEGCLPARGPFSWQLYLMCRNVGRKTKHGKYLQRANGGFQRAGDFVGRGGGREGAGGADSNGEFAEMGKASVFAFHLPHAVEAHRNNRDAKIFDEQADAGLERSHFAGGRVVHFAFGKNQHAVAAVDGFAGKVKALAKAGKLWERKNVEEGGDKPVAELVCPTFGDKPIARRMTHFLECFSAHSDGQTMAIPRRQGCENQADISAAGNVVRNDENRSAQAAEIFAAQNTRMTKNLRRGPDERVVDREAQPADGSALRPARVEVCGAPGCGLLQEALDIGNGFCAGELSFVEFHVELFLESAHQFDAVEGRETQFLFETIRRTSGLCEP